MLKSVKCEIYIYRPHIQGDDIFMYTQSHIKSDQPGSHVFR